MDLNNQEVYATASFWQNTLPILFFLCAGSFWSVWEALHWLSSSQFQLCKWSHQFMFATGCWVKNGVSLPKMLGESWDFALSLVHHGLFCYFSVFCEILCPGLVAKILWQRWAGLVHRTHIFRAPSSASGHTPASGSPKDCLTLKNKKPCMPSTCNFGTQFPLSLF